MTVSHPCVLRMRMPKHWWGVKPMRREEMIVTKLLERERRGSQSTARRILYREKTKLLWKSFS